MADSSNGVTPEVLRWVASVITMAAGLVLAARVRPRLIGWAFVVLTLGSLIWIGIALLSGEYALMAQNIVLTLINLFGIYRWLIWNGKSDAGHRGIATVPGVHLSESRRCISMQMDPDYLDRKNEEIALIARALGGSRCPRIQTIEGAIEEKFRLGAELRARHALRTRDNTETKWKSGAVLGSGPFTFSYRYQRADLAVTGPFPYGLPERFGAASVCEPIYTCSGMAAISVVLLGIAGTAGTDNSPFSISPGATRKRSNLPQPSVSGTSVSAEEKAGMRRWGIQQFCGSIASPSVRARQSCTNAPKPPIS